MSEQQQQPITGDPESSEAIDPPERSPQLFDEFVNAFPEPALAIDDSKTITLWNEEMAELLSVPPADAIGSQVFDVIGTEGESETVAEIALRTEEPVRENKIRSGTTPDGDRWHVRAAAVPLRDQSGAVNGAFGMVTRVTETVEQRRIIHDLQSEMSDEVTATMDDLLGLTDDVTAHSQAINDQTTEQVQNLERTQEEVSGFSATTEEIAASVDQVNEQAANTRELAERSSEAAGDAIEKMTSVAETADAVVDVTNELLENTENITELVDVLNEIANQTNILALNANIEAARSDQRGDGFAVVANEIKDLSDESKKRAEEIETIVADINQRTQRTVSQVESANEEIQEAVKYIQTVDENQSTIVESINETADGISEISRATNKQASRSEELASMIDESADLSSQVSEAIEKVATASDEQAALIDDLETRLTSIQEKIQQTVDNGEAEGL